MVSTLRTFPFRARLRVFAACAWTSLVLCAGGVADAAPGGAPPRENPRVEQLVEEGSRLLDEKKYDAALPKLLEAERISPSVGVILTLGDCYEGLGRTAEALGKYRAAAEQARAKHDDREAFAQAHAEELALRVPTIVVRVGPPAPAAMVVTVDGERVESARWSRSIALDPGHHVVQAALGARHWETSLDLPAEASSTLVRVPALDDAAGSSASGDTPSDNSAFRPMQIAAIAQVTGAVLLVGTGLVFGISAIHKKDESNDLGHCDGGGHCDGTGLSLRHDGITAARTSTILVSLGLVAAASGVVFWLLDRRRSAVATALERGWRGTF